MLKIMPYANSCKSDIEALIKEHSEDVSFDDFIKDSFIFTESGREAINIIMKVENLRREDEVFITTTTNSTYVSTCVTGTIFNFSKISRVLTEKTRMIFVIHTYGFAHPKLLKLRELADKLGVPLVEDCAFSLDSFDNNGILLGSIGDYAIYSLSKIFPMKKGGILRYKNYKLKLKSSFDNINKIEQEAKRLVSVLNYLKKKKRESLIISFWRRN